MRATTEAVTALLATYNEALNASSTEAVMPLSAEDGVFMAPNNQSAIGKASAIITKGHRRIAAVPRLRAPIRQNDAPARRTAATRRR